MFALKNIVMVAETIIYFNEYRPILKNHSDKGCDDNGYNTECYKF